MPTLSRKLKVGEINAQCEHIEAALRPIGVRVDCMCFIEEAIDSLAHGMIKRARALGIDAYLASIEPVDADQWLGDPFDIKLSYHLPDDTQAVLFRTMVL